MAVDEFLEFRFGAKVEWVGGVLTWVDGEVGWGEVGKGASSSALIAWGARGVRGVGDDGCCCC